MLSDEWMEEGSETLNTKQSHTSHSTNIKSKDILKCETFHNGIRLTFLDIEPKMNYYNVLMFTWAGDRKKITRNKLKAILTPNDERFILSCVL